MIAFVTAALISFIPPSTPGATLVLPKTPLREIVYDFSLVRKSTGHAVPNGYNGPQYALLSGGLTGRITIDVMAVQPDQSLVLRVIQSTNAENDRAPRTSIVLIHPDGGLQMISGLYDDSMMKIEPYLGAAYFAGHDLQQAASWTDDSTVGTYKIATTTTVSKVDGDLATIDTTMKEISGQIHGSYSGSSSLVYDAPLLVPVSLDIHLTIVNGDTGTSGMVTLHYQFTRISDTRAANPK
jgi:hypothetical protein